MSETSPGYDPLDDSAVLKAAFPFLPPSTIYNADSQIRNLLGIAQANEEHGAGALISGFLLLHKDLDRIATALEMRNRADTTDRPLGRRLRAVQGGRKP